MQASVAMLRQFCLDVENSRVRILRQFKSVVAIYEALQPWAWSVALLERHYDMTLGVRKRWQSAPWHYPRVSRAKLSISENLVILGKFLVIKFPNFYIFGGCFATKITKLDSLKMWVCYKKEGKMLEKSWRLFGISRCRPRRDWRSSTPKEIREFACLCFSFPLPLFSKTHMRLCVWWLCVAKFLVLGCWWI